MWNFVFKNGSFPNFVSPLIIADDKLKRETEKMHKHNTKHRRGFTLIEVMIVVIILGLLASLVVPNIVGKSEDAKQKLVCVQMKGIAESLNLFRADNGMYPATEEGLAALMHNPNPQKYKSYSSSGYLGGKSLPKDPWKNQFVYTNSGSSFEITSHGSDGVEGGSDDGKDIKFSECQER